MSYSRPITSFRLSPSLREKLLNAGIRTLADLDLDMRPTQLAKDIKCTPEEALLIINTIKADLREGYYGPDQPPSHTNTSAVAIAAADTEQQQAQVSDTSHTGLVQNISPSSERKGYTAFDLLSESLEFTPIVTFNSQLDSLLGGGVPIGKLTEFCGVPGIGKTQIGIQLAVDVHIPSIMGGAEGHCIYIDTEGSFASTRAAEMASALVEHIRLAAAEQGHSEAVQHFTVPYILDHIYYYRVHDFVEQIALVNLLDDIIADLNSKNTCPIRLIVLDSITFLFRAMDLFRDTSQRTRILTTMVSQLNTIAAQHKVAVVLINQVTTKPDIGVAPALGDLYALQLAIRVILEFDGQERHQRKAVLIKSSERQLGEAFYKVTRAGIRDVNDDVEVDADGIAE